MREINNTFLANPLVTFVTVEGAPKTSGVWIYLGTDCEVFDICRIQNGLGDERDVRLVCVYKLLIKIGHTISDVSHLHPSLVSCR